jgi:hypothetical protein
MITIIQADAASFTLDRTVPAAFMSGSFDHLLTDDERLRALRNISDHLEANGRLVLDVWLGLMTDSPATWAGEATAGDTTYIRTVSRRVLPDRTVELKLVIEVRRAGKVVDLIEQRSIAGITDRERVHRFLTETGFEIRHEFGSYDRSPYHEGSSILIIEGVRS